MADGSKPVAAKYAGAANRGLPDAVVDQTFRTAVEMDAPSGEEEVAGFKICGNKGVADGMYVRNIFSITTEKKGAVPLSKLVSAFEAEARSMGASKICIIGRLILNEGFLNAATAIRFGFDFKQIDDQTVQLTKDVPQQ